MKSQRTIYKIAIVGPESTGKSTLCQQLAGYYATNWVPEYAREYINALKRPYEEADLLKIAHGQMEEEERALKGAKRFLFCDTNLMVIEVWSSHKYGKVNPEILSLAVQRHYDFYLLTDIDIPWKDDPQREHPQPEMREYFFTWYKRLVQNSGVPYFVVSGNPLERLNRAKTIIDTHFPLCP